jgi:hypothetical protein
MSAKVGESYVNSPFAGIIALSVRGVHNEERRRTCQKTFLALPWVSAFSVVHGDVRLRSPYLLESRK